MMAVGINLFIVAWVHLTALLTRTGREWNDIPARCLWVDCLLTLMKVYSGRTVLEQHGGPGGSCTEFAVIVPVLPGSDLSLAHLGPLSCHPVIS